MILLLLTSCCLSDFTVQSPSQKKAEETLEGAQKVSGAHTFGAQTFEQLTSEGLLKLTGTKILQILRVDGTLLARSARIAQLEVFGEANLRHTHISGASTIIGYLRAEDSEFQSPLLLGAQKAVFTATKLDSITIRKDDSFKGKQIIELKQGTIVNGSILFESGKGEVYLYPGSQVLGSITGGKLIKKS